MNESTTAKWKENLMQSSEYSAMYHCENDMWWYKGLRDVLKYTLKDKKNAIIIDAGCGTGKNMEFLKQLGHQVYGFDVSEKAVEFSKQRGLDTVVLGDINTVAYPANYADVLLSIDVLTILSQQDIDTFMNKAHEILKKNGLLLIHVAALPVLFSQHDIVCNLKRRYTKKSMKTMLKQYLFFEIQKISYRMFFLFPLIASIKLIKKMIKTKNHKSDQGTPPRFINFLLTQIQYLENFCLRYVNLPIGSSLYVILRKK